MESQLKISDLNPKQRALIKDIVILFHDKFNGTSNIVVSERVVNILGSMGHSINGEKFRSLLGLIRRNDSCSKYLKKYKGRIAHAFIVSSNEGYWWTEDLNEMKAFWESQHGRVCEIMKNAHPLYKLFGYSDDQLQIFNEQKKSA